MARPSQLALASAAQALSNWSGSTDTLGLFVGVGREPGDDGESESALVAAQVDGRVSEAAVAGPCRDLYPPLLPLKTLPNMALAHVSIHLDIRGENGTWCGGPAAGLTALRAAMWALEAGRCSAALVVGADSWTSAGAVRDLLRESAGAMIPPRRGRCRPRHRARQRCASHSAWRARRRAAAGPSFAAAPPRGSRRLQGRRRAARSGASGWRWPRA